MFKRKNDTSRKSVACSKPGCEGRVYVGSSFDIQVISCNGRKITLYFHKHCNPYAIRNR